MEGTSKGDIIVGDDIWIGYGAVILSGITIGQGAIIGAGAIVTKNVPPYAVVGENPAKIIKYRFEENIIKELLRIDFNKIPDEAIYRNIVELYAIMYTVYDAKPIVKRIMGE